MLSSLDEEDTLYQKLRRYGTLSGGIGVGRMFNLTLTANNSKMKYHSCGYDRHDALKNLYKTIKNRLWSLCNDQDNGHGGSS